MFYLYNSNRTEILAEQLGVVVNDGRGRSLFDTSLFLVQSREMGRMLSQFLADRFGVWCNSEYMLPMRFIKHLCGALAIDMDLSAYDRAVLIWRIERLLRTTGESSLQPLAAYLGGDKADLKRYQLARTIAQLFDQYQIMRPDLVASWQRGRAVTDNDSEPWQMYMWNVLQKEGTGRHRGEVIRELIERCGNTDPDPLPDSIYVFGVHTLPPMFVSVLNALSGLADIHFFLLTPCSYYWADMESKSARLHRACTGDHEDDLQFHQLLAGLGRQGADFQHLLLERIETIVERPEVFVVNAEFGRTAVLHRLQDDLLDGRHEPYTEAAADDSIRIVSCHTRIRELGVLKDHLINWLMNDPGLGLHEIVVMAPDIQQYGDLIPALFDDIAHDITDCRTRRDNRYVAIFSDFLNTLTGRYSGPDLTTLLEHQEVGGTYGIAAAELETVKRWLADVGIRWGLSESQRDEDGLPVFRGGTWQDGLERMLLGLASGSAERIDTVLPYPDVEGGDAELLGRLCLFVDMIEQSRRETGAGHSLEQWSALLHRFTTALFGADDAPGLLFLQELLTGLGDTLAPYHSDPVTFDVIRQWFEHEAEVPSASGFLRGRLTFCSMLPMRSIPFKIICLLGINDGDFPKQDRFTPFDLLGHGYRRGDRSRRADDRYQFLEAIVAARQRLYISYVGQSISTNEEIPPSPVVSELIDTINFCYGPIQVQKHPLQPFSEAYFSAGSNLFSHSDYYCRTARSFRAEPAAAMRPWLPRRLDLEPPDRAHLSELLAFVGNPQRFFVNNILGMNLDTGGELPAEHEPFAVEGLDRYRIEQCVVQALLDGRNAEDLLDELQQRQAWPLAYPGRGQFAAVVRECAGFAERVRAINPSGGREMVDFTLGCRSVEVHGALTDFGGGEQLFYRFTKLKGSDVFKAWVCHLLGRRVFAETGSTSVVARDQTVVIPAGAGSEADLSRLIDGYLDGHRYPSPWYVEPAFVYCSQVLSNRGRGRTDPLQRAQTSLQNSIDNGYAEAVRLLFPEVPATMLLGDEFRAWCDEHLVKIWEESEFISGDRHG